MLSVYIPRGTTLDRVQIDDGVEFPEGAIWIDLIAPTVTEDKLVERAIGIAVPTREELQEIEVTRRLYLENDARYIAAPMM